MKKTSALFVLFLAAFNCFAQNKICKGIKPLPVVSPMKNVAVPVKPIVLDENKSSNSASATSAPVSKIPGADNSVTSTGTIIGNTTYDLQSNGAIGNKIYKSGNNIGVVWNFSADSTSSFLDRGTGYNFSNDNGATWQAIPTVRIESEKRGWPTIDHLASGGEAFVSHSNVLPGSSLKIAARTSAGSGGWSEDTIPGIIETTLWAKSKAGGPTGNSVHVIDLTEPVTNGGTLFNGMDGCITYSRSDDAGVTWNVLHALLPGMDTTRYLQVRGESYAIDVKGNTVAICQGSFTTDWAMWKSTDNGNTWAKTIMDSFPIPTPYNDTIETTGSTVEVLIDDNGMIHCWANYTRVIIDSASVYFGYFPMDDGLMYWNENFGASPPVSIASAFDADGNGIINLTYPGNIGGQTVTMMPSAGIDAAGNIFVTYSSILENAVYLPDSSNFRHTYVIMSPDDGVTWTTPYDISSSAYKEYLFAAIAREVDSSVHIVCETDTVPGLGFQLIDPTFNNIEYNKVSTALIINGVTNFLGEINGNIFFDQNGNKIKDTGEFNLQGQKVLMLPDSIYTYTDSSGNYKFYVFSGNYIIQYLPYNNWQITTDSLTYSIAFNGGILTGYDFGSNAIVPGNNITGNLVGNVARVSWAVSYFQSYTNTGTTVLNGSVEIQIDTLSGFVSGNPAPSQINGDTLLWNFVNLTPFQTRSINLIQQMPGSAYLGSFITTTSKVSYDSSAVLVTAVYDTLVQQIVASADPNDKLVEPAGIGVNHLTLMNEKLKYTIRFQNTGTDTAFKVIIFDTLNAALDINTFEFLSSSHPVQTFLNANGALKFVFNNIHLPDSNVNEPASHGFVAFRISPKQGLPEPTVVDNHASIYFDFNAAVVTNTVFNTLVYTITGKNEIAQKNNKAKFYPNPFSDKAFLSFPNEQHEKYILKIGDITGRIVKTLASSGSLIEIQKGGLNNGVYFYLLHDEKNKNIYRGKFVIN